MPSNVLAVAHFVKRATGDGAALNFGLQPFQHDGGHDQTPSFPMPSGGSILTLVLTCIVFATGYSLIRYTLWGVVATLAAVEQPQKSVLIKGYRDGLTKPDDPVGVHSEEAVVVNEEMKTSSIRGTIRHVCRQGSWTSRWRAMTLYIVYSFVGGLIGNVILGILSEWFGRSPEKFGSLFGVISFMGLLNLVGVTITSLILTCWSVAWTHIVISEHSYKCWFHRIPAWRSTIKQVAIPTMAVEVADALSIIIPGIVCFQMLVSKPSYGMLVAAEITASTLYLLLAVFLKLPCYVAVTRVYASLLPADHKPIVHFDRTFGGRVVPKEAGGTGVLSWRDALRSFDSESRRRLVKLYSKIILIDVVLSLICIATILLEVITLFRPQLKWLQDMQNRL